MINIRFQTLIVWPVEAGKHLNVSDAKSAVKIPLLIYLLKVVEMHKF